MKIVVTGYLGFIGSQLTSKLNPDMVLALDKKDGVDVSIMDINTLVDEGYKPDIIVHLAAQTSTKQSVADPIGDFRDNAVGTLNMLELARKTGARFIYTSSRKVVSNKEGERSPYGVSKYVGELYCQEYRKTYGVPVIVNRLGNIYGDTQKGSPEAFWLAWFIKASLENKPIEVYGFEGNQSRDMLHVDDLVALLTDQIINFGEYYHHLDKNNVDRYEIGGGPKNEVTLNQAIEYLKIPKENVKYVDQLPGDKKRLVISNSKLEFVKQVRGWEPKIGWKEGIDRIINNLREQNPLRKADDVTGHISQELQGADSRAANHDAQDQGKS